MKAGERFHCPRCNEDSVVKTRKIMEGFRCTGEMLVCMFCGAEVPATPDAAPPEPGKTAQERLSGLLGVTSDVPERLEDTPGQGFCRDCRNYVRHPFLSRCDRHNRETEPMASCPDFQPKSPGMEEKGKSVW